MSNYHYNKNVVESSVGINGVDYTKKKALDHDENRRFELVAHCFFIVFDIFCHEYLVLRSLIFDKVVYTSFSV